MATETKVLLIDDLDGSRAHETVLFGLDGSSYVIDLSRDNADELRAAMEPYLTRARKLPRRLSANGTARVPPTPVHTHLPTGGPPKTIRQWGATNGFKVSHRGRISRELEQAWADAHP